MIGDNPNSDIAGANNKGWVSILVKTGVYDPKLKNDKEHRAKHYVENFKAALELI